MATPQRKMNVSEPTETRKQPSPEVLRKMSEKSGGEEEGGGTSGSMGGKMSVSEAGRKGAEIRHSKSPEEESAIARKAAETRRENDPNAFSKMGKAGAEARHSKSPEEESAIAKKAAETRKQHDPEAFRKMGEKGGKARGSSTSNVTEEEETER